MVPAGAAAASLWLLRAGKACAATAKERRTQGIVNDFML